MIEASGGAWRRRLCFVPLAARRMNPQNRAIDDAKKPRTSYP
jgi:hypothetical protein